MNDNNETIIGVFSDKKNASTAVSELRKFGYSHEEISVLVKDGTHQTDVVRDVGDNIGEGAAMGAATGGTIGALTGLLVGIGAIAIPGIGALFIGGPLAAAIGLTGAAATSVSAAASGVLAGGLVGALVGIGLPEEVAHYYETRIKEGAVVLAVATNAKLDRDKTMEIFSDYGADQVKVVKSKNN